MTKSYQVPQLGTVTITKRRGAKTMRLRITSKQAVSVTIPYWTPYQTGLLFAVSKANWIETHRQTMIDKTPADGVTIGKNAYLRITKGETLSASYKDDLLLITLQNPENPDEDEKMFIQKKVATVLKKEATTHLTPRINELSESFALPYASLRFRSMKGRWGSCSNHKVITLNTHLINLPWPLIDYVITHELAHTKHLNHSKAFWEEVERCLPTYRIARKELRDHHAA